MTSLAHHWKEEGIQQGMQIGEARGAAERDIEIAKRMLANNYSIPEASLITGISISELNTLLKSQS